LAGATPRHATVDLGDARVEVDDEDQGGAGRRRSEEFAAEVVDVDLGRAFVVAAG